jgi:hypothetical protein
MRQTCRYEDGQTDGRAYEIDGNFAHNSGLHCIVVSLKPTNADRTYYSFRCSNHAYAHAANHPAACVRLHPGVGCTINQSHASDVFYSTDAADRK